MAGYLKRIKRKASLVFCLAAILVFGNVNNTAMGEGNEYSIKAMFVLNFIKYIEWPSEDESNVFRIGVIGETEMYDELKSAAANTQQSRKIQIEKIDSGSKLSCRIIIISHSEQKRSEDWIRQFQGKGVLIISDECNNNNAAINLLNIENKIRFEINANQARNAGIKISSTLLQLAVSVKH